MMPGVLPPTPSSSRTDRSETIFDGDFQTGSVAIGEKFFVSGRQAAVDDRTDGMNDEL